MRKLITILIMFLLLIGLAACGSRDEEIPSQEPEVLQMRAISELATMECYYHDVAKYLEEEAEEHFFGAIKKDRHFWMEYSAVITVGIDASLVNAEVSGNEVIITIPPAQVFECRVDSESLTEDSYIVAKDSAEVNAEHERNAYIEAEKKLLEVASNDQTLLYNAQQRAVSLLEDYVNNLGKSIGVEYSITWIYVDESGNPID